MADLGRTARGLARLNREASEPDLKGDAGIGPRSGLGSESLECETAPPNGWHSLGRRGTEND